MLIPTNLVIIVLVQAIILSVLLILLKRFGTAEHIDWPVAIVIGVGFGVLMDVVLGGYDIFAYLPAGHMMGYVDPRELPIQVLLFNAIASYGLASLSVAAITSHLVITCQRNRNRLLLLGLLTICGLLAVIIVPARSVALMFAWGTVIVGASELILYIGGKTGPVLALLSGKDHRPFIILFVFSAALGSIYETINAFFRFWIWLPGSSASATALSILVALVGYMALFYPMLALYAICKGDRNRGEIDI